MQYHVSFDVQLSLEGPGLPLSRSVGIDEFIILSPADAERFSAELGSTCAVIPNPIPDPNLPLAPASKIKQESKTVVALARLSSEKQLDRMIRNFLAATEQDDLRCWRLDIHGEGEERDHLEKVIAESSASDRVRLAGWNDQPQAALFEASLLLSTSKTEALPMSVLEAAQCATPTLAFECSRSLGDLVRGLGGELVAADDDAAFTERLRALLSSPGLLMTLGTESQRRWSPFSTESVARQWAELVRDARRDERVGHTRPAPPHTRGED